MNEVIRDIDIVEEAMKHLEEHDIYSAYQVLTKLMIEKKDQVTKFEYEMQLEELEKAAA